MCFVWTGVWCSYWRLIGACNWHDGSAAERFHFISCRHSRPVWQGLSSLCTWIWSNQSNFCFTIYCFNAAGCMVAMTFGLFTQATLCVELVFATTTCLSCCLSVTAGIVSKQRVLASWFFHHPHDFTLWWGMTRQQICKGHPKRGRFMRVGWVWTGGFCDFSTYKPP